MPHDFSTAADVALDMALSERERTKKMIVRIENLERAVTELQSQYSALARQVSGGDE